MSLLGFCRAGAVACSKVSLQAHNELVHYTNTGMCVYSHLLLPEIAVGTWIESNLLLL